MTPKPPAPRGKWEATLKNVRALKRRVAALEQARIAARLEALEARMAAVDHKSVAGARRKKTTR